MGLQAALNSSVSKQDHALNLFGRFQQGPLRLLLDDESILGSSSAGLMKASVS